MTDLAKYECALLRIRQSAAVMPHIGPLLDAWDGLANDEKSVIEESSPEFVGCIRKINDAMENPPPVTTTER